MNIPNYTFALRDGLTDAWLPTLGEPNAVGWDVRAAQYNGEDLIVKPFEYVKLPLGFRFIPEPGWWLELRPRSSSFVKKNMVSLDGVIDSDYNGEFMLGFVYIPNLNKQENLIIKFGDPIAQLIPVKRQDMNIKKISNEELDKLYKERNSIRNGGFGSTG